MSDEALRMARAEKAKAALAEFLSPAFEVVRGDYLVKLADLAARPMSGDNLKTVEKLALAMKVATEVEAQIKAIVADGEVARADAQRSSQIARLPDEQRRWATY